MNKRPSSSLLAIAVALELIIGVPFILFLLLSGLGSTPVASLPPLYWVWLGAILVVFSFAFILPDIELGLFKMMDDRQVREIVTRHRRPGAFRLLVLGGVAMIELAIQGVTQGWNGTLLFVGALAFVIFGAGLRMILWSVLK